jgi:hypothetical protein
MEIRPPTEQIDDPFFAAVRRRHPDVDIVVLPADDEPDAAPLSPAEVAAALHRVTMLAGALWSTAMPGATEQPDARFRFGASPASARAVATVSARRADGFAVLVQLRHELERLGWAVARPQGAGIERLTGVFDDMELTASYAEVSTALLLTISSGSLPVGAERAAALTSRSGER